MNEWPASLDHTARSRHTARGWHGHKAPRRGVAGQPQPVTRVTAAAPVCIALSTYNGSAFLREQLSSFLIQSHDNWSILWRDDESTDCTRDIIRAFAAGEAAGRVIDANDTRGRLGITASFMALVHRVPPGQILAFADQDDVWLGEKLARGVAALSQTDPHRPALYCARQILVDQALHRLADSAAPPQAPGFPQSLTQNIATGCTVMLNPAAVRLLTAMRPPLNTLHDWWAYLVVTAAGGDIVVDDEPTVLYRQHASNAVGVKLSFWPRALAAVRRGPGAFMAILRAHVAALEEQHDLLSVSGQESLAAISAALQGGWPRRVGALLHPGFRRQCFFETQLFRLWFLLG